MRYRFLLLFMTCLWAPGAAFAVPDDADTPAATISEERQGELRYMLEQDCGSCHGLTRKGGLGTALLPENLQDKPDDYLFEVIKNGLPGTPMPPWNELLTDGEINWMIEELRNFNAESD